MPIPFCQLLEKAVKRNDIRVVENLCVAYQMISDIAFQTVESADLPAIFLSAEQYKELLFAAKKMPQILNLLQQLKLEPQAKLPVLIDAKDQTLKIILSLEKLFQSCKNKKNWDDLNKLWDARCKINTALSEYFPNENLIATQEINFYFPYVLEKVTLRNLLLELLEAWCTDKSKYSYEYISAMLYKVIAAEMLDSKGMIADLDRIIKIRNTAKNTLLTEVMTVLKDCITNMTLAKWKAGVSQAPNPHAENAIKTIGALKVRFEFVKNFLKEEKYKLVVKELCDDMKALSSEYKQYDKKGQLAQCTQMLSAQTDAKAAYRSRLSGIDLKPHDYAAQQKEKAAFAEDLKLTEPCKTASAGTTPAGASTSKSAATCLAIAPGGPG